MSNREYQNRTDRIFFSFLLGPPKAEGYSLRDSLKLRSACSDAANLDDTFHINPLSPARKRKPVHQGWTARIGRDSPREAWRILLNFSWDKTSGRPANSLGLNHYTHTQTYTPENSNTGQTLSVGTEDRTAKIQEVRSVQAQSPMFPEERKQGEGFNSLGNMRVRRGSLGPMWRFK